MSGSVIAVDIFGTFLIIVGLAMVLVRGTPRAVSRTEDPRRTARLIFGTMIAALGASIIILFTLFALDTA
jgi:hypothetical protein